MTAPYGQEERESERLRSQHPCQERTPSGLTCSHRASPTKASTACQSMGMDFKISTRGPLENIQDPNRNPHHKQIRQILFMSPPRKWRAQESGNLHSNHIANEQQRFRMRPVFFFFFPKPRLSLAIVPILRTTNVRRGQNKQTNKKAYPTKTRLDINTQNQNLQTPACKHSNSQEKNAPTSTCYK